MSHVSEASPRRAAGILAAAVNVPAPVAAFGLVYIATCWIGATCLLLGPSWFREWYVYLSGAEMPRLAAREVAIDLVLLNVAACLLVAGWFAAGRLLCGVFGRCGQVRRERFEAPQTRGSCGSC